MRSESKVTLSEAQVIMKGPSTKMWLVVRHLADPSVPYVS